MQSQSSRLRARVAKNRRNKRYSSPAHKRTRASYVPLVLAGIIDCARCGEPIEPGSAWDLGHDDIYPDLYSGPEHLVCNRGAPHRNVTSREW